MPDCPRCHQSVDTTAITCPYCRTALKAHGHPGMTLYRATGAEPLCLTCTYHADDSCTFPKRPDAMDCTLYHDRAQPQTPARSNYVRNVTLKSWFRRNLTWFVLLGLVLISLLVAVSR
ncbi:zinc ribbon domain-containing protein [Leptolyngbya sp. FACHB-36]|uniref:zinc ribbon domain-containing protein n=1 Tax=Leptolyngbya sp. FACHB-36 TaxID=2692808 RepID=UPI001680710A|nr:zinc ribbon domain-containing protein [Leptolyngbya sp. FACHB-36]MBD2020774.1 zinc ribbon domain-containing protein [Leptolyngbya sp. FACHB-36]